MALINPTFIFGVLVLLYLSSFIVFAILRIVTGISIQRVGYFSLRHIAYTLRDGVKIEIRGLGLVLHRPTFSQPTWLSIVLEELQVTVDLKVLGGEQDLDAALKENGTIGDADGPHCAIEKGPTTRAPSKRRISTAYPRSRTWERLTNAKNKIKRLHRKIKWIRMVDLVATNMTCTVTDIGYVQVGSFTLAVDTRRKTVDRGRLFHPRRSNIPGQRPAEWMLTVRSVLFTPEGKESLEILDHCALNVHGILYQEMDGLRDASIALKLGRVHIPYDDILVGSKRFQRCLNAYRARGSMQEESNISLSDVMEELGTPGTREEEIVQTVSDSKEFASSILRGIKEVQFAVSFVGVTKNIYSVQPGGSPLTLNMAMKEVGIDLHRLDQKSPAHRMYFLPKDVAHQALIAAISISVGVDDEQGAAERLLYVPMATTTIKTTLPSRTLKSSEDSNAAERNANILFANMVVTSPSLDLDPKHLPLVLALLRSRQTSSKTTVKSDRHHLISRLLPKANLKISVHEPVVRVVLPPSEPQGKADKDFDLLISSISSISLDVESSHSAAGELHYSLASSFRIMNHHLYYQASSGIRYNLLQTEALELKTQVSADPEVRVVASGELRTFSVHMIRPEISEGVRQIVRQLRTNVLPTKMGSPKTSESPNFLRTMPAWLLHFQLQGSGFGVEVAGIDPDISQNTRGVAVQLESWTAEYKAQKVEPPVVRQSRRRGASRSLNPDEAFFKIVPPSPKKQANPTDGRRLALHIYGLEAFVVESMDNWEPEPFLSLPRFEVACSTSTDANGPIFHINSHLRTLYIHYSLYRHYAFGVATMELRKAFVRTRRDIEEQLGAKKDIAVDRIISSPLASLPVVESRITTKELIAVDVKASLVQVKVTMPSDPNVLFQVFSIEGGRHRWASPFVKVRLARLLAETPKMKKIWARIVSIKVLRLDFRESRRKVGSEFHEDKSFDIATDAVRLAVPHQIVLYKVFDNFVNVAKAVEQLHHRFKTGTNEYVLDKKPEGPKKMPKVSFRSKGLLVELEDGLFEWKLGLIYRVGLTEQKQRIAREAAYHAKVKRLLALDQRRGSSRIRTHSLYPHGRGEQSKNEGSSRRSRSTEEGNRERSESRHRHRGWNMRYNPQMCPRISGDAKVSSKDAWHKLQEHNAQSWKKRIDYGIELSGGMMKDIRGMFWGADNRPNEADVTETILDVHPHPGLMVTLIKDLHIVLDKPSFPIQEYALFLHRVGKGMPYDTKYSLLLPMSVKIDMGETRTTLRDYPLPLLHIPSIRPNQPPRLSSWTLKTDFVIAEEYRDSQSQRHVKVNIVPPDHSTSEKKRSGFAIDIRRTVSPVKTYSDVNIDINTGLPSKFTWGTSYQPAIQDMMMVIESFTKPQVDPSDRVGFWDKIRLSVHSRVNIAWKGDGDVQLMLKGSRDPYVVTGHGAGFVMCWRNDVRWSISKEDDPRKFMTVNSGEYMLAIPDYGHQARHSQDSQSISDSDSISSLRSGALFKKVVMKLSGNVQWLAGLVFERNVEGGKRSFDFTPHYKVTFKNPEYAIGVNGRAYDAFDGFRSHHIHLSIAVVAPLDRDWSVSNLKPSPTYNSVHLTPRFFTHFFSWWSLFSGIMSLPIRQGKLWPGIEKSSKKFGRHLATIKYNLLLSPLFMSHVYKHRDAEDYPEDVVSATGLKIKLDSFMLDLHQRREEFSTVVKGRKTETKTSGMRINEAQLDFISADIRAISASIAGTTSEDLRRATDETLASHLEPSIDIDMSRFTIPDNDFDWVDMDDFVELDWILPTESNPETKIMPLAYAPHFTYFRQTDHDGNLSGETDRSSTFGNEPTHHCVMSKDKDPRRTQCDLIRQRLEQLEEQIKAHTRTVGDAELKMIREDYNDEARKKEYEQLKHHATVLHEKKLFLSTWLKRLSEYISSEYSDQSFDLGKLKDSLADFQTSRATFSPEDLDSALLADVANEFNNRFIVHNVQLKWNNALRNIILRYIHQVSQRRGFVYYLSRRAVKFILDIVDEQSKSKGHHNHHGSTPNSAPSAQSATPSNTKTDQESTLDDYIKQLLDDSKKFVHADDPESSETDRKTRNDLGDNISNDFMAQNSYHVRLVAPQIQLQSEKNLKTAVLLTSKGIQLKVIQVMDKNRLADDVSGLVQRRFSVHMEGAQFFVTNQKEFPTRMIHMYAGNRYGAPGGSFWPPWVPLEVMFDFKIKPFGFSRVVQRTSASLKYSKYNTLRLKYNDELTTGGPSQTQTPENLESRVDHLSVEFPEIKAVCDSVQYYGMYIIVLDLLLYSEPLEKVRNERLEKIMLASDFSDLRGAPEMVIRLQERIRQINEIKTHFQVNAKYLDRQGWEDRLHIEQDLAHCEDELFFMMKAITTAQKKYDDRSDSNGVLRWYLSASRIIWHLTLEHNKPLMEFQLQNALYDRTDNSDGSDRNELKIEKINGLNLLPNATYPEMIAPFYEHQRPFADDRDAYMLRIKWHRLEAVAGIPVMQDFEVTLFPLKIQLESEISDELFKYIFRGSQSNGVEGGDPSPLMVKSAPATQDDEEDTLDESRGTSWEKSSGTIDISESSMRLSSLSRRLKPTMALPDSRTGAQPVVKHKPSSSLSSFADSHHLRIFQRPGNARGDSRAPFIRTPSKKPSEESLRMTGKTPRDRSGVNLSSLNVTSGAKRLALTNKSDSKTNGDSKTQKSSDDLTQMISRASNYMTLAYVKIPSVVLCLSYKGKGDRNFQDVHEFVFRMPVLQYRNKTWSNLDLAMQLKKDVIKALISHTGSIISNRFSHHRPNKAQQTRLREIANSSAILNEGQESSETSSMRDTSPSEDPRSTSPTRTSFALARHEGLSRTDSFAESVRSIGSKAPSTSPALQQSLDPAEDSDDNHSFLHTTMSRHFKDFGRHKDGEDSEER
ncbi:MAG: hypothetical protein M1824_005486 [Vezdaea acicularis]|nr:MAG: hypothetical protein M1824_005486 [Vezdaea acicularis]